MKSLLDSLAGQDVYLLLGLAVVVIVVVVVSVVLIVKAVINGKDKKQQNNPISLEKKHVGHYFKVIKVNPKKAIAFLRIDPSIEHPFGIDEGHWCRIGSFPGELFGEYKVIKVIDKPEGGVSVIGHGPF